MTTREDSIAAVLEAATSGDNCAEPTVFCAHWHDTLEAAITRALDRERIRTLEAVRALELQVGTTIATVTHIDRMLAEARGETA